MKVIKINHSDFSMQITLNYRNSEKVFADKFKRAKIRNTKQYFKTNYIITEREGLKVFSIWIPEGGILAGAGIETIHHPIFFENLTYDVTIEFERDISNARIFSKSEDVKQVFDLGKTIKGADLITGKLRFSHGIGDFELVIDYDRKTVPITTIFKFQVFSSMVSLNRDVPKMTKDIDKLYPRLILDFMKMTNHPFYQRPGEHKELIWWFNFNNLYSTILNSLHYIIEAPYTSIERIETYEKAGRIRHPKPWQMERFRDHPEKFFPVYKNQVTSDNQENRIIKYIVKDIIKTFQNIYSKIRESDAGKRMTTEYRSQLEFVRDALKKLLRDPFFDLVSDIDEIRMVPHVLTMRPGYEEVFTSWRKLKEAYGFFDGIYSLEFKDNVYIYQLWCFATVIEVIESLGGKLKEVVKTNKRYTHFALLPEGDINGALIFRMSNGDIAELHLELIKDIHKNTENESTFPDFRLVVRKAGFSSGTYLTYLFNACYRSVESEEEGVPDLPHPNDKYRLQHLTNITDEREKSGSNKGLGVAGSVLLYPSLGTVAQFKKILEDTVPGDVSCIAFNPGQPATTQLVKGYLSDIFNTKVAVVKDEALVAMPFIKKEDLTLIHYLKTTEEVIFCHDKFLEALGEGQLRYIAPNIEGEGIPFIWEVKGHNWKPRREVYPPDHVLFNQDPTECLVLKLYRKDRFKQPLQLKRVVKTIRYTKMSLINKSGKGYVKAIPERETRAKR
jgi:uncharacterized protein